MLIKMTAWCLIAGCAGCSAFRPKQQVIFIDTVPPNVHLTVDGQHRGPAPISIGLDRNVSHHIVASTQGSVYSLDLQPKLSTAGVLDIFGASLVLVPGIGLLTPGAYDLDTMNDTMSVTLHLDAVPQSSMPSTQPPTPMGTNVLPGKK